MTVLNDLYRRHRLLPAGAEIWITETEARLLWEIIQAFGPSLGLDPDDLGYLETLPRDSHFCGRPIYIVKDTP